MRLLLLFLLIALTWPALAQGPAMLCGRVLDAETQQPVPNAQVGVAANRIGTTTNLEGYFALAVPPAYQHEPLEVALLGYRKYTQPLPPLPGPALLIRLQINPTALGEVMVTSSVTGIIREAVARIPRNYPVRPTRLTGFYREADNLLADSTKYQYFTEGLLTVDKAGYQHPTNDGEVEVRQSRKVDWRDQYGQSSLGWFAGPFIPHRFDFVHQRLDFINPAHFRDYTYRLTGQTSFGGRPVYVIAFAPKPGRHPADFAGRLYIEENSYAFLRAEWHRTPAGIRHEQAGWLRNFAATERAYRVDYQPYAGRWHLKSVWYRTQGHSLVGSPAPVRHLSEYLTTAIDTAPAAPLPYPVRAQFRDIYLENTVPYDSAFWRTQTTLVPPAALQQALRKPPVPVPALALPVDPGPAAEAPAPPPEAPPGPPAGQRLGRFRYGFVLGPLPLTVPGAEVQAGFAPAGTSFQALGAATIRPQRLTYWSSFSYEYRVVGNLSVRVASRSVARQLGGDGWELGLTYEHNLTPRHRPVFARWGLAYTRQNVYRGLGPFHNSDADLRVAGTRLKADELALSLQTQTNALQPKVGLGLELSHRVELVADLGYLLWPSTRTRLQLEEVSGFWLSRSTVAFGLDTAGATLRVAGQPATAAPWQLHRLLFGFGLLYRVR